MNECRCNINRDDLQVIYGQVKRYDKSSCIYEQVAVMYSLIQARIDGPPDTTPCIPTFYLKNKCLM